jgi:hypothetical protein
MSLSYADLPHDPDDLRRAASEMQRAVVRAKTLFIEKLKMQLAVLRRGRSSEKLDQEVEQLELLIGDIEETGSSGIASLADERGRQSFIRIWPI